MFFFDDLIFIFQLSVFNSTWHHITSDYVQVLYSINAGAFVDIPVNMYSSSFRISLKAATPATNQISLNEIEIFIGDTHYTNR